MMDEFEQKEKISLLQAIIQKERKIIELQFEVAKKDNKIEILEKMLLERK